MKAVKSGLMYLHMFSFVFFNHTERLLNIPSEKIERKENEARFSQSTQYTELAFELDHPGTVMDCCSFIYKISDMSLDLLSICSILYLVNPNEGKKVGFLSQQ